MFQHDFILLDRSGSMEGFMWTEALGAINGYVKKLADDNVDTGVTLACFDSNEPFVILRDRIIPNTWRAVTDEDAQPRGGTPLNDATGKLLDLAESGQFKYDKVAIIIMTDGQENSSKEYTVPQIKARLDRVRAKNWQVIFLGANFDNASQAASYGNTRGMTVNSAAGNLRASTSNLAAKRAAYGATGQSINFSDEEKDDLATRKTSNP
jgi:uncharacterized protein with von Willebrand factor type A (vWA) domain